MKKDILIGIDIGSSNVKTVLFNSDCELLAIETQEYPTLMPKPGWTEYNANDWWECVINTLNKCFIKTQINLNRIAAIAFSSLGACPVPMDADGNVLYNCIPWSDQRAQLEVDYLNKYCRDILYDSAYMIPTTLNGIPHVMWLKNNEPVVYDKMYKFVEPSGFLGQRFTGEFTMDWTFASGLWFGFDKKKLDYNKEIIDAMGLDIEKYPRLHKNTESIGVVSAKAEKISGIPASTPVFIGGPDVAPGALAAGALYPGQGYYSMGSGANMMVLTDKDVRSPYMVHYFHNKGPELIMLDGVQGSIGYSIRWFRDQFGGLEQEACRMLNSKIRDFEIMDLEAINTKPGSGGIIYLPYLHGKFHPELNPNAKGAFIGISPTTTRLQIIRSIMEGCSYDMYQSLKVHFELGLDIEEIIATGGPSKSDLWCQIMADVSDRKIVTVNAPEAAPFGDAILAGVGVGIFSSFEDVAERAVKIKKIYEPNQKNHNLYMDLFEIYEEIYEALYKSFDGLAKTKIKNNMI